MRKIIGLLLFIGFSVAGYAQSYQPISTYGYQWKRGKFDIALLLPQGSGSTLPSDSVRDGAIRYNPSTASMQIWVSGAWGNISSGGSIKAIDSARLSNDTLYFRYKTGGELAVKLNDIRTASHGLTKTNNDVALGGTYGDDGNDITILGKNYSGLYLQGTSGTNYSTDLATTQLRVFGAAIQMEAVDRTNGNLSQYSFSTSGVTTGSTKPISLLSYNGGSNNKLLLSPDSVNLYGGIIKFSGPIQAYNLRNNSAGDSILCTDSTGVIKQKLISNTTGIDSNFVKSIMNIDTVSTIALLQSYNGRAKLLFVSDIYRGGLFYLSTTGTADNGIIFSGAGGKRWIRSGTNNMAANVQWFGAIPNDGVDDYAAFLAAVLVRKDVFVPAGQFLLNTQCPLVANQRIYGVGNTSILYTANNIALIATSSGCTIENLYFLGSGKGTTTNYLTTNGTQYGIKLASSNLVTINNCYFKFLGGAAIYVNISSSAIPYKGNAVSNCVADSCFNGYFAGSFGEYTNFTNCKAFGCDYGVHILGGNTGFDACNITYNLTGVFVDSDRNNDAHGFVSNSKINHNVDYSIRVDSTFNSFLFSHNMVYYSNILVKNVVLGVRFIGNDFASMDSIKIQNSVNIEFNDNKFITKLPLLLKNWNGTDNTGSQSNVTFFNDKYVNGITSYSAATQPQNQLFNNANIYSNSIHWGSSTGASNVAVTQFQDANGLRTAYLGDAASFDSKMWITMLNGADLRFASQSGDASALPILLNALFSNDGFIALGDSVIDRAGYLARVRVKGSLKADSIYGNTSTPLARYHLSGTTRIDLGSDAKYDLYYRDSATGTVVRLPSGTIGQVLTAGNGGKPQWSTPTTLTQNVIPLKDFYTDASSSDTIYAYTVPNIYLANVGDKIRAIYSGTFVASATAHSLGISIAGTLIGLSNGTTSGGTWQIESTIIRVSNTVVRVTTKIDFDNSGVTASLYKQSTDEITGLNLSSNGLRVALAVGSPNTNVTGKSGTLVYIAAAP